MVLLEGRPFLGARVLDPAVQALVDLEVVRLVLRRQDPVAEHKVQAGTGTVGLELARADRCQDLVHRPPTKILDLAVARHGGQAQWEFKVVHDLDGEGNVGGV